MGDVYRFRSGEPINDKHLCQAIRLCIAARDAAVIARAFDGIDDNRRDDLLDTAAASLSAAKQALVDAMTPPEPPKVSPIRTGLVAAVFDIAGQGRAGR